MGFDCKLGSDLRLTEIIAVGIVSFDSIERPRPRLRLLDLVTGEVDLVTGEVEG